MIMPIQTIYAGTDRLERCVGLLPTKPAAAEAAASPPVGVFKNAKNDRTYFGEYEGDKTHGVGVFVTWGHTTSGEWVNGESSGHRVVRHRDGESASKHATYAVACSIHEQV